jgi:hypothetical protein
MKTILTPLLSTLILVFATPSIQATSLLDLFDGDTITVRDKLFDDWTNLGQSGTGVIDISLIDVTGIDANTLNPGLLFTTNNQLTPGNLAEFLTFKFGFSVTVLDPQLKIKDNSLEITEFIIEDTSFIYVNEVITDINGTLLSSEDVIALGFGNNNMLFDSAEFAPQDKIFVKNFIVSSWEG